MRLFVQAGSSRSLPFSLAVEGGGTFCDNLRFLRCEKSECQPQRRQYLHEIVSVQFRKKRIRQLDESAVRKSNVPCCLK